jgi:triacylglycerol lipase
VAPEHLRELGAMVRLGAWHLRARFADGPRRPRGEITGRPVLLVHGFTQNGTNWWGLRRRLERAGRPTVAVSLGRPFRTVAAHSAALVARLRALAGEAPDGVDVVAHSMGGIVLRHVLAEHPDLAPVVRRVVTLGSPHGGTAGARLAPPSWRVDFAQLAWGSPYLRALPALARVAPHAEITTVAATADLIVYPIATCHERGARRVDLPGLGHAGLLTRAEAHAAVLQALGAEPARLAAK